MSRPRGFTPWKPQRRTLPLLVGVTGVLDEYSDYLPLTIRQIFYRLIGKGLIGKTEKQYGSLIELIGRARRDKRIPMGAIRDDGFVGSLSTGAGWESPDEWIDSLVSDADGYARDRQEGQQRRLLVWCEAGGMVPQLERVAFPYGVSVASSGGFDSLTVKHDAGQRLGKDEPVTVLHIGDWDASGECMYDALAEDICAFANHYGNDVEFVRLAVTAAQVARYELPTAPPKDSSHQRQKRMTETVQAEALDPATLAEIAKWGIDSRLEEDIYRQAVKREVEEREQLKSRMHSLLGMSNG